MKRLICILILAGFCLGVDGVNCNLGWPFVLPGDGGTSGINGGDPAGQGIPETGVSVSVRVISQSMRDADVLVIFFVDGVEVHRTELRVDAGAVMEIIGPDLANSITAEGTYVGGGDTPFVVFVDFGDGDIVEYIIPASGIKGDPIDECPFNPDKMAPGQCGCDIPDTDSDDDGTADCNDGCPDDPDKVEPGQCGCGEPDTDTDEDGTADCNDECPDDPDKIEPGDCGCGKPDEDRNHNGISDCLESKPGPGPGPVVVTQACCFPDGSCSDLTEDSCIASEGTPQGSGSDCETAECPQPPPTEACCFVNGDCEDLPPDECAALEGTPQGSGSDCETAECPQPPPTEACCFVNGDCEDLPPDECTNARGTPMGPETDCGNVTCTPAVERVRIFWTTLRGEIGSALPDRANIQTHLQDQYRPDDIDITFNKDAPDLNTAYWFSKDDNYIRSAPLTLGTWAASQVQELSVTIDGQMRGMAVGMSGTDGTGNYLVWTELLPNPAPVNIALAPLLGTDNGIVKKLDLDATPLVPVTLYTRSVNAIDGALATKAASVAPASGGVPMAVVQADRLWWSEWQAVPPNPGDSLWLGDLAGKEPLLVLSEPLPTLETRQVIGGFFNLDVVYWSMQIENGTEIHCTFPDGSTLPGFETIVIPEIYIGNIAFDWFNGKVYWTVPNADKIMRANIDGSMVEDFLTATQTDRADLTEVSGIAVGMVLEPAPQEPTP